MRGISPPSLSPPAPRGPAPSTTPLPPARSKALIAVARVGADYGTRVKAASFVLPKGPATTQIGGAAYSFPLFDVNPEEVLRVEVWADVARDHLMGCIEMPWAELVKNKRVELTIHGGRGPAAHTMLGEQKPCAAAEGLTVVRCARGATCGAQAR